MNARVTAVLFAALAAVAHGHAFMTKPSPRQSGVRRDDQKPTDKAQAWFTFNTEIKAGAQTVCKKELRTVYNAQSTLKGDVCNYPANYNRRQPWFSPGTAPVLDPCGTYDNQGGGTKGGTSLNPKLPRPQWKRGGTADVWWRSSANHGGGYAYRICPLARVQGKGAAAEKCFQEPKHHLTFTADKTQVHQPGKAPFEIETRRLVWDSTATTQYAKDGSWVLSRGEGKWTRNPISRTDDWFPMPPKTQNLGRDYWEYSLGDKVKIPADIPLGDYVVSWRWDTEGQANVWLNCADVTIVDSDSPPASTKPPAKPPTKPPTTAGGRCIMTLWVGSEGDCDAGNGKYDMTDFIKAHPGGEDAIDSNCGDTPVTNWGKKGYGSHTAHIPKIKSKKDFKLRGGTIKYLGPAASKCAPTTAPKATTTTIPKATTTTTKGTYKKISDKGDCCRNNGAFVGRLGDGKAPTPQHCQAECDAITRRQTENWGPINTPYTCKYFSHAMEWKNCIFCSFCDLSSEGNAGKYTSWRNEKVLGQVLGTGGSSQAFCDTYKAICGDTWDQCLKDYNAFEAGSGTGKGDTKACRAQQLAMAQQGDTPDRKRQSANTHCPGASKTGGNICKKKEAPKLTPTQKKEESKPTPTQKSQDPVTMEVASDGTGSACILSATLVLFVGVTLGLLC